MLEFLERIGWFVGLVLVQVLVLSHVHIYGYATPFLYIFFVLSLNSGIDRNILLIWAFAIGLTVDIFCNTPGMHTAAITLVAFLRQPILKGVVIKEVEEEFEPCISTMGFFPYLKYTLLCTLIFCSVVEMIDTFSFFDLKELGLRIITDTLITLVCIFCVEAVFRRDKSEERF